MGGKEKRETGMLGEARTLGQEIAIAKLDDNFDLHSNKQMMKTIR